jgi:hypothetical protein
MKAVSISETSVNFYQTTQCNIPEDRHHHCLPFNNIMVIKRETNKQEMYTNFFKVLVGNGIVS